MFTCILLHGEINGMSYSGTVTVPGRHPSGINCLTNAMKSTFMPYKPLHVNFEIGRGNIFFWVFRLQSCIYHHWC